MRSAKILIVSKLIFISFLLIFLVNFFGIPSLERYLEKSTVFVNERVDYDFNNPPPIMITRGNMKSVEAIEQCLNLNDTYEAAVQCIDNKVPTKDQMILEESKTGHQDLSLPSLGSWRMYFDQQFYLGKSFILEKYQIEPIEWLNLRFLMKPLHYSL